MAITLRHDASAVVPPSNNATRKYGQQLVLQQQQQKYATQQAQQDRMFDAYKMENQQQFQDKRDTKQVINQQLRDWQQQDFQKQQMEAARQQQFMDDARKLSSGMIMDDIKNGHYDPATAGKLRKNLVDEADALADKTLDATQRKKVLDAIRADRLLHTSNRMEKPPAPTDQDRIDSLPVMDGVRYGKDKDGNPVPVMVMDEETGAWKPYEKPSSSRSSGQKGAKGDSGASQRPVTFEEYYGADEDKFQEALNTELQTMQDNFVPDPEGKKKMPTREDALNKMRDDYDFRQKALGKAQYGEPTPAKPYGQALEEARQASKNKVKGGSESFAALSDMNDKLLELENRANSFPKGSKEASAAWSQYRKERDRIINGDIQPAPEMRSILEQPGQQQIPATPVPSQPAAPSSVATTVQPAKQPAAPDFGALASRSNGANKQAIVAIQNIYQSQTPDVQAAISVLLDDNSQHTDAAKALAYLQSKGIDITPEMRSILEQPGQQQIPATPMPGQPVPTAPSAPSPAQPAPSPPVAVTPPSPAQNAWEQVATPPATPTPQATPQSPAPNDVDMGAVDSNGRIVPNNKTTTTKQKPPQSAKQPAAPDFGALASRSNGANKQAIVAIQNIYQSQTPDVQAAISVLLDDNSQHTDAAKALAYLQSKGIDIRSLTAKSKPDTQYRALGAGGR